MAYINLNIPDKQIKELDTLAKKLKTNRSAYIRKAIDYYLRKTEREFLVEQFKQASEKCREESLMVCREFENIDKIPE